MTTGSVEILDGEERLLATGTIDFAPGDVFLYTSEWIQLIYNGQVLDYRVTEVKRREESFTVRNAGAEDALDVHIQVIDDNRDVINLSFDGEEWESELVIDRLVAAEEKTFFLRIIKDNTAVSFCMKKFEINIY